MKIIVSHDVDHLYTSDHYLKDLIVEKFIVRGIIHLLQHRISFHTFISRAGIVFTNKMNNLDALMSYDREHNVSSTFFFGMNNGLGMSYSRKRAIPFIKKVRDKGFDVGVHGIEYRSEDGIKLEYDRFKEITGMNDFGIRNHYVRFDKETFPKMDRAGYLYDSTQFNKEETELVGPYKIGHMWEFPLHIMDCYICKHGDYKRDLEETVHIIEEGERRGINYLTILFHDDEFNRKIYPEEYDWYVNLIEYLEKRKYQFISFKDAIKELEANG